MKRMLSIGLAIGVVCMVLGLFAGCSSAPVVQEEVTLAPEAAAPQGPTAEEIAAQEQAKREQLMKEASSFGDIYFAFDRYDLFPESRTVLEGLSDWLLEYPEFEITIEGHCDERGTTEYNLALGERRAEAAKAYLVNLGIDAKKISTISYGEELPVDPGHNEAAWSKNRRDHFVVFPKNQ